MRSRAVVAVVPFLFLPLAVAWSFRAPVLSSYLSDSLALANRLLDMRWSKQVPLAGLVTTAAATNLYVSSYAGTITSLQLSQSADGSYSLNAVSTSNGCANNPSWLTKDEFSGVIYCTDEGLNVVNGTLNSFKATPEGVLSQIDRHDVPNGPVSSVVYNGGRALAVAHYGGSALTSWLILPSGKLERLQAFFFTLSKPGPVPSRQDAPHPHEVIVDPTGRFLLSPDLGADLVHVYTIDPVTNILTASTPFEAPAGTGPRHGAFYVSKGKTFFYLVSELANLVTSYEVTYYVDSLSFKQVFVKGIDGNNTTPSTVSASEVVLAPNNYLVTASRGDLLFDISNFNPANTTKIPSDSLQSWKINSRTGKLTLEQLFPAGGSFPRQFSVNKAGTLVAVGLQFDSRVVVIKRSVTTGLFEEFVAEIDIPGQITSVIWDE